MVRKITVVTSLIMLSGCGLGHPLQEADQAKETYKACIFHQIQGYSARDNSDELIAKKVTQFAVSKCSEQEDAYVVAMTKLAMAITGNTVSPEKFLEDKDVTLREDLHQLAANITQQSL